MPSITHNIKSLILASTPIIAIETTEEDRVDALLQDLSAEMVWTFFDWSLVSGLVNRNSGDSLVEPNHVLKALIRITDIKIPAIFWFRDLGIHLDDPLVSRQLFEILQAFQKENLPLAIIATGHSLSFGPNVESFATHLPLELPKEQELQQIATSTVNDLRERLDFDIQIETDHIPELVKSLHGLTANQARQKLSKAIIEDRILCVEDIKTIGQEKAAALRDGGLLEYFPPKENRFLIGGFDNLKDWLKRARMGYTKEAVALNLRPPKGVLLVGVQGCGKSLAAKIIARDWNLPLLKLDAGRLFDKYIGESERNMRKALSLAETLSPCVLWIDEVEKGFGTGGGDSTDGGTSKRMLGTFLSWMQEHQHDVFIVATANDLESLPPEFTRKGRFDELFFVDLPTATERAKILSIHLQLRNQQLSDFEIPRLVEKSLGFSGAEIEQAVIAAAYESLYRNLALSTELVAKELSETIPLSITRKEAIQQLRDYAKDRFVPVSRQAAEVVHF